ncbi:MAG: hypothetical protein ACLQM8_14215 [Limisphaerales bacterium]
MKAKSKSIARQVPHPASFAAAGGLPGQWEQGAVEIGSGFDRFRLDAKPFRAEVEPAFILITYRRACRGRKDERHRASQQSYQT